MSRLENGMARVEFLAISAEAEKMLATGHTCSFVYSKFREDSKISMSYRTFFRYMKRYLAVQPKIPVSANNGKQQEPAKQTEKSVPENQAVKQEQKQETGSNATISDTISVTPSPPLMPAAPKTEVVSQIKSQEESRREKSSGPIIVDISKNKPPRFGTIQVTKEDF